MESISSDEFVHLWVEKYLKGGSVWHDLIYLVDHRIHCCANHCSLRKPYTK